MKKKRAVCATLCGAMLLGILGCAATTPTTQAAENDYEVLYYSEATDTSPALGDVMVITEEELQSLGPSVLELLNNVEMLYLVGDTTVDTISDITGIPVIVHNERLKENIKIGTALSLEDGEVHFNEVFAIFTEDTSSAQSNNVSNSSTLDASECIEDGIHAAMTVSQNKLEESSSTRMAATGYYTFDTSSAVIYNGKRERIGSMGYTLYFYKLGYSTSGTGRLYDCICISTFAPETGYYCDEMSVTLDSPFDFYQVIDATNIVSNSQTYTHSLGLTGAPSGISITGSTSWSFTVDAQTVTKQFDMTASTRKWIFQPRKPGSGDAWIEEPGVRMYSTSLHNHCGVEIYLDFTDHSLINPYLTELHSYAYFVYD